MQPIKISGYYRCHDYAIDNFLVDIRNFIDKNKTVQNHIVVGDINIDLIKFDDKAQEYFYYMQLNDYQSLINTCTHPHKGHNSESCIDHVFLRSSYTASAGKIVYAITDHYPILCSFHGNSVDCDKKQYFQISKNKFLKLCKKENWNEIFDITDTEEAIDNLINKLNIINKMSIQSKPKKNRARKNWMTSVLVNSVNTKNKLYKDWKNELSKSQNITNQVGNSNQNEDQVNQHQQLVNLKRKKFLNYETVLKRLLRTARNLHKQKQLQKADSKDLWEYVHAKLDLKQKSKKIGTICDNKIKIDNDVIKANMFNNFFSTVADRLQCSATPPIHPHVIPDLPNNQYTLFLSPVSEDEVQRTIKKLKNKAGGYNGIHTFIIKLAAPFITPILT